MQRKRQRRNAIVPNSVEAQAIRMIAIDYLGHITMETMEQLSLHTIQATCEGEINDTNNAVEEVNDESELFHVNDTSTTEVTANINVTNESDHGTNELRDNIHCENEDDSEVVNLVLNENDIDLHLSQE
jgi:copper chaperone CopZ